METDSRERTDEIHTDVEGAGGMGSIKFKLQQVAGLGVVSQPQGHTQDYTSCKLQHTTQHILQFLQYILLYSLHCVIFRTLSSNGIEHTSINGK